MVNIVFMGSPDFAVPSFLALLRNQEINILATCTRPPKPKGRGLQESVTAIQQVSEQHNIKVLHDINDIFQISGVDFIVVVAYGKFLPKVFLDRFVCINLHPSLLPKFRGPAPIQYALLHGEKETGVSIMMLTEEMDAGDLLMQEKYIIKQEDDYHSLSVCLANMGAELLIRSILEYDSIEKTQQDERLVTFSKKIDDLLVNWEEDDNLNVYNKVRAFLGAKCRISVYNVKIIQASLAPVADDTSVKPGTVINKQYIKCKTGFISPIVVQPAGKKKMSFQDFYHGYLHKKSYE